MKRLIVLFALLGGVAHAAPPRYQRFYGINFLEVDPTGLCANGTYCLSVDQNDHALKLRLSDGSSLVMSDTLGITALGLGYAATIATWSQGIISQSSSTVNFARVSPAQSGNTSWYQQLGKFSNNGARSNHVMNIGWNLGAGAGRVTSGALNGAMGWSLEQYYEAPAKVMEGHFVYMSPADVQTRMISCLAGLETPYSVGCYHYANTLVLGSGKDNNDPASLNITSTATVLTSPSGYRKVQLTDSDGSLTISNGDSGNSDRAHLLIDNAGTLTFNGNTALRLYRNGSELRFEGDSDHTEMKGPDATSIVRADNNFVLITQGGTPAMYFQSGRMQSGRNIYPLTDSDKTLGGPSQRWSEAMIGGAVAAQDACDATTRGATMTVFATTNNSDTLQVCMKAAANTYAWRTVYTAP